MPDCSRVKGVLTRRENYLRAADFRRPEYIPAVVNIFWPVWNTYREELERIARSYALLFPDYGRYAVHYEEKRGVIYVDEFYRDPFGCIWRFRIKGYQGQVVGHPLDDWRKLRDYSFPDPDDGLPVEGGGLRPWEEVFEEMDRAKEAGELVVAPMPHGFFFQRLYYLRGFRNLMRDFILKPPEIYELVEALTEYNLGLVDKLLEFSGIDVFYFGDDLGAQSGVAVSPRIFEEFIYPAYKRIFSRAKASGARIRLHTDGRVIEVIDQLIKAGVDILNVQDRVNGLENLKSACWGRVCIDLDLDRQVLIPFCTPQEIKDYIRHVVETLGSRRGGLMLYAEVHPPTPLENIKALAEALMENIWLT